YHGRKQSMRSSLAEIGDGDGKPLDAVVFAPDVAGFWSDEDANPGFRAAGFTKLIPGDDDRLGLAVDVDGRALVAPAVHDAVLLEPVSVRREGLAASAEVDPRLAAAADVVVANEVVRIAVAEGHAVAAVLDHVL